MKSFTGNSPSVRGWALLLALLLGAGMMISACGDEEVPAPTTPAPTPPPPAPEPEPEPEPTPEPPATPTGLHVDEMTATSITWHWNAVEGALGYAVQVSMDEMFDDTDQIAITQETSFTATPVPPETSVYLRVRSGTGTPEALAAAVATGSLEGLLLSDWSTHVTGMTTAVPLPPAPANLRVASRGSDYIEWAWDTVEGVDGYQSQFSTSSDFSDSDTQFHQGMNMTSRRVSNLDAESDGYLRVRTYTGTLADHTVGMWSEGLKGTTDEPPPAVPLDAPTGLDATDTDDDSITLEWDSVRNADTYEVEQREPGDDWEDASCGGGDNVVDDEECVASDLSEGTDYDFRVRAVPADDDARYTTSDWSDIEETRTSGTAPPEPTAPVGGGMGDLNVTWESTADSITWNWAPMTGVGYEWALATGDMDDADPCGGTTFDDLTTAPAGSGNRFSHTIDSLTAADGVRGLCVRTDDKDNRATSFAWGVVTPAAATATQGTGVRLNDDNTVASAMTWTDMVLVGGFNWETRLVADPQRRSEFDVTQATVRTGKDMQAACSDGRAVESGDADVGYTLDEVAVRSGLTAYTGYSLCLRFSNATGQSSWAVPEAKLFTHPGQPARPAIDSARSTATSFVWRVATRNATNVPRESGTSPAGRFEVRSIHYDVTFQDTSTPPRTVSTATPSAKDCEARTAPTDRGTWNTDATVGAIGTDGAGIVLRVGPVTANVGADANTRGLDQRVFVCVRAVDGADRNGPWQISGASTVRGVPGT